MKYCANCGNKLEGNDKYCNHCGSCIDGNSSSNKNEKKSFVENINEYVGNTTPADLN